MAVGLTGAAVPVWGHHAFATEFDSTRPVRFTGTVTKVELINPHSWIHIDVKNEDGTVSSWMIEGGSPNALLRRGVNKDSIPIGAELLVDGYGSRDGENKAVGVDLTFADGTQLFLGGSQPDAP
jgi:hypothetical protein